MTVTRPVALHSTPLVASQSIKMATPALSHIGEEGAGSTDSEATTVLSGIGRLSVKAERYV